MIHVQTSYNFMSIFDNEYTFLVMLSCKMFLSGRHSEYLSLNPYSVNHRTGKVMGPLNKNLGLESKKS